MIRPRLEDVNSRRCRSGVELESAWRRSRSRVIRGEESPSVEVERGRLPESVRGCDDVDAADVVDDEVVVELLG